VILSLLPVARGVSCLVLRRPSLPHVRHGVQKAGSHIAGAPLRAVGRSS